ncbi:MAG: cysteine desulfurase family protein [Bdellovibrionales bacterium]
MKVDLTSVDFASFSAHKFYALQGVGFIFQKKGSGLEPLIIGGGQEKGRRAGTENLLGIHAFGEQVKKLDQVEVVSARITELRDYMESEISRKIEKVDFLAQKRERICNTSLMLISGVHGETMLINMDLLGFEISTGAACSSGNPEPSPVLIAMGLTNQQASKSLRVSLGWQTTQDEIDRFVEALVKVVEKLRGL